LLLEQAISDELVERQSRLERDRLVATDLGRTVAMSPVASSLPSAADDLSTSYMPASLMHSADHVAQHFALLQQALSVLTDLAERQNNAAQLCQGAAQSVEKQIDTARQVRPLQTNP
jgi:hypothetical protein